LLPASLELLRRLKLFGIHKMGHLAQLPCEAIAPQFGTEGEELWKLANGIDGSRLLAWRGPEMLMEQFCFEPAAESPGFILSKADELLSRLTQQLRGRWQYCRRATMSLFLSNGHIAMRTFHLKEPTSSKETMLRHLSRCLEEARFAAPVSEMRLILTDLCPEEGKQMSFFDKPLRSREKLASAIKWLKLRYGKGVVQKILPKEDSVLPEDSFSFIDFDS